MELKLWWLYKTYCLRKDYRKFKIKTVIGANDFASMKEVVNRRYSRMLVEAPDDLPQLVVIDGGEGQLEFARQALAELGLMDRLMVIGLAKRMELVIRVNDPYPLFLDRNSRALKVLMQIRDEAHRFGITFHRSLLHRAGGHPHRRQLPAAPELTGGRPRINRKHPVCEADLVSARKRGAFMMFFTAPQSDTGACRRFFCRTQWPPRDSGRCTPYSGCNPRPRRACPLAA